ncbi:MAG: N-6 DNA methylase, partial [Proteobacteria bacterium]|nr:N-6 DNA methylase [Pseudomonadota bacterium]
HFFDWSDFTNQPVMYLLLPEAKQAGRVALVLPSESRQWRQRQVLTHPWDSPALLTPMGRLQQGELELMQKVEDKPMFSVPLVEWAFYKPIATAKELAQELARVSRQMEQAIPAVYAAEGADGYLKTLYESFKRELLPTLKVSSDNSKDYSFADIYAQTIAYGLFTARVFSHVRDPKADFNRQDAWDKLPETNPFLRQLFQGISEQPVEALGDELADKISEVFSILRAAKMDAILSDFRQKMNREDIVIRFYEDFLAAYKPEMRERRGVYYTPEPVVSYMVRSVDILLKEKFDKPLGLADPEVMILDPACGTGTFLLKIFQEILKKFEENPEALMAGLADKSWSGYVKERLLPRIFGFELLMAPYAICHLKLN